MMSRLMPTLPLVLLAGSCGPVLAADYHDTPEMRSGYDEAWATEDSSDPLGVELGLRYWYSMGRQNASFGGGAAAFSTQDATHSLEGHLRLDDYSTQTYFNGYAGYSAVIGGSYSTPSNLSGVISGGRVGYAVADLGWLPFGTMKNGAAIGGLVGYQYWNDSPDMGRGTFYPITTAADLNYSPGSFTYGVPGDSAVDNLDIHALRLGVTAHADLGGFFDVNAEVAGIPYAWVNGTLGAHEFTPFTVGNTTYYKNSSTSVSGHAFGAAGELMLGVHPTQNLTLRFGGRAWYLAGNLDATYGVAAVTAPADTNGDGIADAGPGVATQKFITSSDFASLFRYGALFEMAYSF